MKFTALILSVITILSLHAEKEVSSNINSVTVYQRNAQITRNISAYTEKGTQELILTGISSSINPNSIQVQFTDNSSSLLSVKYMPNHIDEAPTNDRIAELKDILDLLNDDMLSISDEKAALEGMLKIINSNMSLENANSGFTATQVSGLSDSYRAKYLQIKRELNALSKKQKPLTKEIKKLNKQLKELNAKFNKPSGNIILKIASSASKNINFKCKYIVNNAGWSPLYDLRAENISSNVNLNYKANVYQNTGIDWKNVRMVISSETPTQDNNRPILNPLYANIYRNQYKKQAYGRAKAEVAYESNMAYDMPAAKVAAAPSYVSQNQMSVSFNIINPQTILTDGKENSVSLKSYNLNTNYIYHTVPKLKKGAFLIAKISNWSQYNLVPGNANIFFEGSYVGKSYINPEVTSDTLLLSMGMDKGIVVERIKDKDFCSSKFIGSNKSENIGYDIKIKNKKSRPITIEILDQIPVSQNKLIQVQLLKKDQAKYTARIGKLLWTETIQPGQSIKKRFAYSVKYPKKSRVRGIK